MPNALQAEFTKSLLAPALPPPVGLVSPSGTDTERRFAVYRNNVVAGLIRAMESRFPVVARLVGDEFFRAMAYVYITDDLPRSPILFRYGSTFPSFIEAFEPAADVPYLADVARLELARGRAYHAADALPLAADAFADLDAEGLASTAVRLHPSVELLTSRFPVVSIWWAHKGEGEPHVDRSGPEAALVARPGLEVEVHALPPGGYQFLGALAQGASISRAAAVAAVEAAAFDAVANFSLLIEARIVTKLIAARPI